jgi:ABC-type sugar transport system substrate-binding protein
MKRYVRKYLAVLCATILVVAILTGCAAPSPSTTPTPDTTPTPSTTPTPDTTPTPSTTPTPDTTPSAENPFEGLGVKPDGTQYEFVYSVVMLYNPWTAFTAGIFEHYGELAGLDYRVYDQDANSVNMASHLEDFLITKPDGVLLDPVDGDAAVPGVDALMAAGIPVFVDETAIISDNYVSFCTHDNLSMGEAIGEWTADYFEEKGIPGRVYECKGMLTMVDAIDRHEGFMRGIEGSNTTIFEGPDCSWSDEQCANAVMDAFPTHDDLNAVFTHGGMLQGACEGLNSIGMLHPVGDPEHILAVSVDDNDATCTLLRDGWADAVCEHSPWRTTDLLMKQMFTYIILGEPVTKLTVLPSQIITPDIIQEELEKPGGPTIWGLVMAEEDFSYDNLPVIDCPYIETPTKAMLSK